MWKQNHINGTESFNNSTTHGEDIYNDTTNPRLINGLVVLVLLILNLSGNSLVFYIYRFRVKTSVFSFFVTTLAALDIITALTTMLLDVIIKVRPLDENILDLYSLCKITHFQVYAHSLISGCLLTLIAHQRYRKVR
uniref:G-protein coupled receptors family 1 profile domain-containing protein n=1 Tax=Arion vulgaris TaxID=1028688 RepID=A0A0B6Z5G7_9EUPU